MNILILTGRFGMGHYSAATTLAQEVKAQYPGADITVTDIFEAVSPNHYQSFYNGYTWLVNKASVFYNVYYRATERSRKNVHPPMMFYLFGVLGRMLEQVRPDVVFSTLPLCSQLVSQYKKHTGASLPLVTCITDISTHNEWINDYTDYYMVGSEAVKEELLRRNVPQAQIYVTGIPVKAQFKQEHPAYASTKKHLLIMGGGLGLIPKDKRFYERLNACSDLRTTIILGNNRELYEQLHGVYENIEVIGYTDKVYEYMQTADALLSKPGGITMFETIYSELPMIVLCPFLQQEIKNAKFIDRLGLGCVLWDKNQDAVDGIQEFMEDTESLMEVRRSMQRFKQGLDSTAVRKILCQAVAEVDRLPAARPVILPRKGAIA